MRLPIFHANRLGITALLVCVFGVLIVQASTARADGGTTAIPASTMHPQRDPRTGTLSYVAFRFIEQHAPLPKQYAYLLIFLAISLGGKVVGLPLYLESIKFAGFCRRNEYEISSIRQMSDQEDRGKAMLALYAEHNVKPLSGCGIFLLDTVIIIWGWASLFGYKFQLAADGAAFWHAPDVTVFNASILGLWAAVATVDSIIISRQPTSDISAGAYAACLIFGVAVIAAIAWHFHWPAYVLLFIITLTLVGRLLTTAFQIYIKATE